MSELLLAATGQLVTPGRMIQATTGTHAGSWWRLEGHLHNGREHVVRVCRRVGRLMQRAAFPLQVFGLALREFDHWWKDDPRHTAMRMLHKLDEYLLAGLFALIPLGVFEGYNGAEHFRQFVEWFVE